MKKFKSLFSTHHSSVKLFLHFVLAFLISFSNLNFVKSSNNHQINELIKSPQRKFQFLCD